MFDLAEALKGGLRQLQVAPYDLPFRFVYDGKICFLRVGLRPADCQPFQEKLAALKVKKTTYDPATASLKLTGTDFAALTAQVRGRRQVPQKDLVKRQDTKLRAQEAAMEEAKLLGDEAEAAFYDRGIYLFEELRKLGPAVAETLIDYAYVIPESANGARPEPLEELSSDNVTAMLTERKKIPDFAEARTDNAIQAVRPPMAGCEVGIAATHLLVTAAEDGLTFAALEEAEADFLPSRPGGMRESSDSSEAASSTTTKSGRGPGAASKAAESAAGGPTSGGKDTAANA